MKLRTSLQVSAVFPITLAIMVSLSLILRARQVDESQRVFRSVENLTRAAAELHIATYACLLHQNSDAVDVWRAKQGAMVAALNAIDMASPSGQILLDRSKDGVKGIEATFAEFTRDPASAAKPDSPIRTQILTDSDALVQNAFELSRMADSDAEETRGNADMFFAVFIGIMGLLMAAATLSVSRDVVNRLARLNEWTRSITEGKLDAKIDTGGRNDEVGQLVRAFSDMTGRLGSAYGTMEKEIVENKRVADALRESNVLLSNALEKLKRAQHQIIQQERLHVLEQVVRGVAHDFNNTLTPILGMSDFMLTYPKTLANTEKVMENLKDINEAAYRARKDVKKLSEFFRPIKGSGFQTVDLNDLVSRAIQLMEPRWRDQTRTGKGPIGVQTELGQVPAVAGDSAELKEVLTSLLMNAVEAMPKGGQITISTRLSGANVVVEITDTGEGMTDDVRERCLEPFFSTKGIEGTGMGLTIVNNAVRRHGGTLEIRSQRGKGTTVAIGLPVWSEAAGRDMTSELPMPVNRALRILVIDDESWSRDIVSRILSADGHQVQLAVSGKDGLEKMKSGDYELVITDRAMPDMSGDEVAAEIRAKWPHMPIILLTGFGDIMKEEGDRPGCVDVILSKPITMGDLGMAIAQAFKMKR